MKRLASLLTLGAALLTFSSSAAQEQGTNYFVDSDGEKRHYVEETGQFGGIIYVRGNLRLSSLAQEGTEEATDPAIEVAVDFDNDGNFDLTDKYILYRLGYEERHPTQEIHEPYYTAFNPTFSWYDSKVRVTYLENVNLFRNVPPFHPPGTEVWHTDEKGNLVDRLMWVCGYDKMPGEHFREPLYCVTPSINYSVDPECVLFSVEGESHRPSAERRNSWFSSDE
jgi:hypothetical protein